MGNGRLIGSLDAKSGCAMREYDAVVLGGGPAGSTVATLLAQAGQDVVVLEKEHFPRYHIGESLLPATVAIWERLGVHEQVREASIRKPGGKWLYGRGEVPGDFSNSDTKASFKQTPYSYLVERSTFDEILLNRSAECGADVRFGHTVRDLITDEDRVVGVRAADDFGTEKEFRGRLVFDATGLRAVVGSRLGIREPTTTQRMGVYAQYKAKTLREDANDGWFVGQMFYNGWTWMLNLPGGEVSVGVVLPVARFKELKTTPEELMERMMRDNELLSEGLENPVRSGPVRVAGNMGNSCTKLVGDGWVMVGDAAFFIDPCYSSGVHVAMVSGEKAADMFLSAPREVAVEPTAFTDYEDKLRHHQKYVTKMVDSFYLASRNTSLQKLILKMQGGFFTRKFVTFVGGDFAMNASYIGRVNAYSKFFNWLLPNNQSKPENQPSYPLDIPRVEQPAESVSEAA